MKIDVSKKEIKAFQAFADKTACKAGAILKEGFNRRHQVKYKGRIDPVTEYDVKSEKFIVSAISKTFPDHSILAEEGNDIEEKSPFRWVIDPLDGTVNYAHRFPVYCVSIGLQYKEQSIAGAVYDPERDELFSAGLGLGACLNSKKIHVSKVKTIEKALLATGFSYNVAKARKNNLGLFARMVKTAQAVRRPGSAAIDLCWLADGRIDGFWEFYLHPWDTAAAVLIVTEAGGKISRLNDRAYSIFDKDILASNGLIHTPLRKLLTGK